MRHEPPGMGPADSAHPRRWVPPGVPDTDVAHISGSLARGLSILECFTSRRPVWDAAGIAQEFGIGQASARRYLTTLAVMGYLTQLPGQGRHRAYRLGLRVTDLGLNAINSTGLGDHARLHLQRLANVAPIPPRLRYSTGRRR